MSVAANSIARDKTLEMMSEFVKVQISPSLLKQFCEELQIDSNGILLSYAIEMCKASSSIRDSQKFISTIQTATASLRVRHKVEIRAQV